MTSTTATNWSHLPDEIKDSILQVFCLDCLAAYDEELHEALDPHPSHRLAKKIDEYLMLFRSSEEDDTDEESGNEPQSITSYEPPKGPQSLKWFHSAILVNHYFYTTITSTVILPPITLHPRHSDRRGYTLPFLLRDQQQAKATSLIDIPAARWRLDCPRFLYVFLASGRFWDNPDFPLDDYLCERISELMEDNARVALINHLGKHIAQHVLRLEEALSTILGVSFAMPGQGEKMLYLNVRKRARFLDMGKFAVYSVDGLAIPAIMNMPKSAGGASIARVSRPGPSVMVEGSLDELELVREIKRTDSSKPLWLILFKDNKWVFVRYGEGDWNYIYEYPYACHALKCRKIMFGGRHIRVPFNCLHEQNSYYEDDDFSDTGNSDDGTDVMFDDLASEYDSA